MGMRLLRFPNRRQINCLALNNVLANVTQRGVFFSDLTSEQSRKLFKKFVHKWNSGLLKKVSHSCRE